MYIIFRDFAVPAVVRTDLSCRVRNAGGIAKRHKIPRLCARPFCVLSTESVDNIAPIEPFQDCGGRKGDKRMTTQRNHKQRAGALRVSGFVVALVYPPFPSTSPERAVVSPCIKIIDSALGRKFLAPLQEFRGIPARPFASRASFVPRTVFSVGSVVRYAIIVRVVRRARTNLSGETRDAR